MIEPPCTAGPVTLHAVSAKSRRPRELLRSLALAQARLEQLEIVLDVGVAGVLALGFQQRFAGALGIAAQNVGVAAVVEDLGGRPRDLHGLVVGAVGELEPAQAIVGSGKPEPRLEVARMQLDGAAEVALGRCEIPRIEMLLAERELVLGVFAG